MARGPFREQRPGVGCSGYSNQELGGREKQLRLWASSVESCYVGPKYPNDTLCTLVVIILRSSLKRPLVSLHHYSTPGQARIQRTQPEVRRLPNRSSHLLKWREAKGKVLNSHLNETELLKENVNDCVGRDYQIRLQFQSLPALLKMEPRMVIRLTAEK